MSEPTHNHLFVSDFHIAIGLDPTHGIYSPREDFLYDDEFARFLRWADADANRPDGKPWELVFVGDCFDFLPVELAWMRSYDATLTSLAGSLTARSPDAALRAWENFLAEGALPGRLRQELYEFFVAADLVRIETHDLDEVVAQNRTQYGLETGEPDEWPDPVPAPPADELDEWCYHPCDDQTMQPECLEPISRQAFEREVAELPGLVRLPGWAEARAAELRPEETRQYRDQKDRYGLFLRPVTGGLVGRWFHRLRLRLLHRYTYRKYQHELFFKQEASVAKLCAIYNGHRTFFQALAWWVGRGHRLVVIPGNHDLELVWPAVQTKFEELLAYHHRESVRHEWEAAGAKGKRPEPDLAAFNGRIDFSRQWFYYKPGAFYAEHGHQYDNVNATINQLGPYWTKDSETLLNPSFGSLGNPIVAQLEDTFPEWDNVGSHASTLSYLMREYPQRFARVLARNFWGYADLILSLLNGTRGTAKAQGPSQQQFDDYHKLPGHDKLPADFLRTLYASWDPPLLLYRRLGYLVAYAMKVLAIPFTLIRWLLEIFRVLVSPRGFLLPLLILLIVALARPATLGLPEDWTGKLSLPDDLEKLIGLLGSAVTVVAVTILLNELKDTIIVWLRGKGNRKCFQVALFGEDYVREAGRATFELFEQRAHQADPNLPPFPVEELPRYYIFGHDHDPHKKLLKEEHYWTDEKATYYLNTGSWLSWFAGQDARRLRSGGKDLEFTFVKIWEQDIGWDETEYRAELLRWNDDAGRAEEQVVISHQDEPDEIAEALKRPVLPAAGLGAAVGLGVGLAMGPWLLGLLVGAAAGALLSLTLLPDPRRA